MYVCLHQDQEDIHVFIDIYMYIHKLKLTFVCIFV